MRNIEISKKEKEKSKIQKRVKKGTENERTKTGESIDELWNKLKRRDERKQEEGKIGAA
ncbi:hypothetical protein CCP4SC76_5960006 [Gammaproteobacteria bacterium]